MERYAASVSQAASERGRAGSSLFPDVLDFGNQYVHFLYETQDHENTLHEIIFDTSGLLNFISQTALICKGWRAEI